MSEFPNRSPDSKKGAADRDTIIVMSAALPAMWREIGHYDFPWGHTFDQRCAQGTINNCRQRASLETSICLMRVLDVPSRTSAYDNTLLWIIEMSVGEVPFLMSRHSGIGACYSLWVEVIWFFNSWPICLGFGPRLKSPSSSNALPATPGTTHKHTPSKSHDFFDLGVGGQIPTLWGDTMWVTRYPNWLT